MGRTLHITSGDCAGERLAKAGLPGEVFVWHDILYDGPRRPGWPDEATIEARAAYLEAATAGGLGRDYVLATLRRQYRTLADAAGRPMVLWFDACLFDQAMLAHLLACLHLQEAPRVELLCLDAFPGMEPFHGLGQLQPDHLASVYGRRQAVSDGQYRFAVRADAAFAARDDEALAVLARTRDAPLPAIPAAAARWLEERPDPATGLGRLESLALAAIRAGCRAPARIFASVAAADTPPHYWGDTTLWAAINALAARDPPRVRIEGPTDRLPQWPGGVPLDAFRITAWPGGPG